MNNYPSYSVCGIKSSNIVLHKFLRGFYKVHEIKKDINGSKYIVQYVRSPFWGYEKPTLKSFLQDKLCLWHGQVWEVLPGGSRIGFGTTCFDALFPRKRMRKFLNRESKFVWHACNDNNDEVGMV